MDIEIPKYPLLCPDLLFKNENNLHDPFHFLENVDEKSTSWISQQNELSAKFIKENELHPLVLQRLKELYDFPKISTPFKVADFYCSYQNTGLQNHNILFIRRKLDDQDKILLDPNELSSDGSISLKFVNFSKTGEYFSYGVSSGGSDWTTIRIKKRKSLKKNEKYSNNLGFLYKIHFSHMNIAFSRVISLFCRLLEYFLSKICFAFDCNIYFIFNLYSLQY
jgi:prolyl oligopeptidase PreP (S9A serine peptidase family)